MRDTLPPPRFETKTDPMLSATKKQWLQGLITSFVLGLVTGLPLGAIGAVAYDAIVEEIPQQPAPALDPYVNDRP